jgi:hypothetical protein
MYALGATAPAKLIGPALSVATRRREPLAGEPCGIIGCKENGDAGDVLRLSGATERRSCDHRLLEVAPFDAGALGVLGLDATRRNSVDPDFSRTQLSGEPACYCIYRAFGPDSRWNSSSVISSSGTNL